ncbi:hypothetical protein ACFP1Z_10545 [Streptomyces gamaensis]|uniref:Uncharacterized protein n=1 Tax=Streptomyces gamaensis TaxID=1763542 RepID=A0ABW0Z2I9_9ACTN
MSSTQSGGGPPAVAPAGQDEPAVPAAVPLRAQAANDEPAVRGGEAAAPRVLEAMDDEGA